MGKAFILVTTQHKKAKLFINDIRKLCMINKRKTPPIPREWIYLEVLQTDTGLSSSQSAD